MVTFFREACCCDALVEIVVVDKVPSDKGRVRDTCCHPYRHALSVFENLCRHVPLDTCDNVIMT